MPAPTEILTLAEASRQIQSRKLSPVELVRTLLARIEALDGQLHAFITPTPFCFRYGTRSASIVFCSV